MKSLRFIIPALLLLPACELATPNSFQSDNVTFAAGGNGNQQAQILQKYCATCHAPGTPDPDEKFVGWTDQQFIDNGLVVAGDPNNSELYQFMIGVGDTMPPPGNPTPSDAQIQFIADWISGMTNQ